MNKTLLSVALTAAMALVATPSFATAFTSTTPTGVDVTASGASSVGGIVVELVGSNGARVLSQLAASTLYVGYANANPFTVGTQAGFDAAVTSALGGGLQSASIRFSLFDGDTASGNFDFNNNDLLVNGINFGDWSVVQAENTDGTGSAGGFGFSGGGFRNNLLDTGWFFSSDAGAMSSLYASLISLEQLTFQVQDVNPYDNYYDFTQGIDQSLINVGQGPVVTPPTGAVPEPASLALLGLGLAGLGFARRRKHA